MAGELLRENVKSTKVMPSDVEQTSSIARLQRKVKSDKKQPAPCSAPVFSEETGNYERDKAGSSDSEGEGKTLKNRKEGVTETGREFGRSVAQYIKKVFRL